MSLTVPEGLSRSQTLVLACLIDQGRAMSGMKLFDARPVAGFDDPEEGEEGA